jgi:hypothetical protein
MMCVEESRGKKILREKGEKKLQTLEREWKESYEDLWS